MECIIYFSICKRKQIEYNIKVFLCYILPFNYYEIIPQKEKTGCYCTAPQKLDIKNLTFGVFFNEINL